MASRIELNFEKQASWIGEYREAALQKEHKEKQFIHLNDQCKICLEKYVPEDSLIVLPCSHGFHEKCFAPWEPQTCPFDRTPNEVVSKISLLGHSLLFPSNMRHFASYLHEHKETIELELKKLTEKFIQEKPDEYQKMVNHPDKTHLEASLVETFLQDLLDTYGGLLTEEKIPTKIASLLIRCQEALKSDPESIEEIVKNIGEETELTKFTSAVKDPSLPSSVKFLAMTFSHFQNVSIDGAGIERAVSYAQQFIQTAIDSPEFSQVAKELDNKFFTKHLKAIQALPTQEERIAYLSKQSTNVLNRIGRLNQGEGPASESIRQGIATLTENREWVAKLQMIALLVCISTIAIAMALP